MRYLVTGGAGFLGSALANRLVKDGHEVRVLDDLSSGDETKLLPQVFFTKGDINNIPLLWSLLQDVDCVYHLAAKVSVAQSVLYPLEYNKINVGGTVSLMEAMRDAGIKRVVMASSGAIYGAQHYQPVHEDAICVPDSPYAVSKWSAEQYVHTIGELWGIETVALRIFNAYGPGQNLPASHAPVVPRYLHRVLTGGSLVLYGDGNQSRDFVYVSDVLQALVKAGTANHVNRKVINIGSGQETTIRELVSFVEKAVGRSANVLNNVEKRGGVQRLVADISIAKELLNFQPKVSLAEGLAMTLAQDAKFRQHQATVVA
jgi:UDP-glucose 4-epimerase